MGLNERTSLEREVVVAATCTTNERKCVRYSSVEQRGRRAGLAAWLGPCARPNFERAPRAVLWGGLCQ